MKLFLLALGVVLLAFGSVARASSDLITVGGAVSNAGLLPYRKGMKLTDAIAVAGGAAKGATDKITLVRRGLHQRFVRPDLAGGPVMDVCEATAQARRVEQIVAGPHGVQLGAKLLQRGERRQRLAPQ